ncbi:MAG: carbohydrate ABC transporter permease, partial [Firmicutes bacterium]|nr:carbohydrate ABC transporter permease [Bacillota bacterium]
ITTSLSDNQYALSFPPKFLPTSIHLDNYIKIFTNSGMGTYIRNTLIITIPAIAGQVITSSLAAYAFARLRAPGRRALFMILLSTLMIPGEVTLIPTFVLFRDLNWINTFWPLIVPNFFGNAFNIFLMRQFIAAIPVELDEAARIDGLGPFGIWRRIIMPLSLPSVTAVAIFTFNANWGSFLGPLIYINNQKLYPLALGVYSMTQSSSLFIPPQWNLVMAGSMLLTLPMILVYFFGQRFIYEGSNVLGKAL